MVNLETPTKSTAKSLEEINIVRRMETKKNESITKISCNNEDNRKISGFTRFLVLYIF